VSRECCSRVVFRSGERGVKKEGESEGCVKGAGRARKKGLAWGSAGEMVGEVQMEGVEGGGEPWRGKVKSSRGSQAGWLFEDRAECARACRGRARDLRCSRASFGLNYLGPVAIEPTFESIPAGDMD
jgi:hypothetical protein